MAWHESHERKCPTCNEWMSATAPRCLNCGEYVDDDDDEFEPMERAPSRAGLYLVIAGAVVVVGVIMAMVMLG